MVIEMYLKCTFISFENKNISKIDVGKTLASRTIEINEKKMFF